MTNSRKCIFAVLCLTIIALSLVLYRTIELGRDEGKPAFLENLNPAGKISGPEGIQFDSRGDLYVGDAMGIVWKIESGEAPSIYAELSRIRMAPGAPSVNSPIKARGIAIDPEGNLYVAAYGYAGGSIIRIDAGSRTVRFFARDMGVANFVLLSRDNRHLWVSDYRADGRLLRYPLAAASPAQPDLIVSGLASPNGLAWGRDALYTAETYTGDIARVDLTAIPPALSRVANLKGRFALGSLDGLAFDPRDRESRFLYVAENLRGVITILDLNARPARVAKRIRLAQMGGRPCPASMVIQNGYLYFTDLWSCSPLRILLRMPEYREHAYRFPVTNLASVY